MSYIYHLVGENLELAEAELKGFLRSQALEEDPDRFGSLALTDSEPEQLKRLGLVHKVSEIIHRGSKLTTDYKPEGSYAVRAFDFSDNVDKRQFEQQLGEILSDSSNSVDLEDPDEIIDLYVTEKEYIVSKRVIDIDRSLFKQRKNQERPFSSPVSLDPYLARVLVNLSEAPAAGNIIDPFCGTGGILIEAGLCGIMPYGSDIQQGMVEGTAENLENYGVINHDVRQSGIQDISETFSESFDAIVTDLPYGKASKSEGSPVEEFLDIAEDLDPDKTVFMYNKPEINSIKADYDVYVHKNLTRYIYIID